MGGGSSREVSATVKSVNYNKIFYFVQMVGDTLSAAFFSF
jgi:hypothetical protein